MMKTRARMSFLAAILAFSAPSLAQDRLSAPQESPGSSAGEIRRGFSGDSGFTYRPGFPRERRNQEEEFGLSPLFEAEGDVTETNDERQDSPLREDTGVTPRAAEEPRTPPMSPTRPRDEGVGLGAPGDDRGTQEEFGTSPRFEGAPFSGEPRGGGDGSGGSLSIPERTIQRPETTIQR